MFKVGKATFGEETRKSEKAIVGSQRLEAANCLERRRHFLQDGKRKVRGNVKAKKKAPLTLGETVLSGGERSLGYDFPVEYPFMISRLRARIRRFGRRMFPVYAPLYRQNVP